MGNLELPEVEHNSSLFAPAESKPSPKAMGKLDIEVIIYINFEEIIPDELQQKLRDLEQAMRLSG
jgi:hypothetical protein